MTVTIGIDPHKRTHTAVAIDDRGKALDQIASRDQGLTHMEALRCLKRQLAQVVGRTMLADAERGVGPGGTNGNVSTA